MGQQRLGSTFHVDQARTRDLAMVSRETSPRCGVAPWSPEPGIRWPNGEWTSLLASVLWTSPFWRRATMIDVPTEAASGFTSPSSFPVKRGRVVGRRPLSPAPQHGLRATCDRDSVFPVKRV